MTTEFTATRPLPESYRVYRRLRDGVRPDALQLGHGRNLLPPPDGVVEFLAGALASPTRRQRLVYYDRSDDRAELEVIAAILSELLGFRDVTADDLFVTEGATKGISATFGALAPHRREIWLPLPTYFGFELSAMRHGTLVTGYYRPDTGAVRRAGAVCSGRPRAIVETVPNAFSGCVTSRPPKDDVDVTVLDSVLVAHGPREPHPSVLQRLAGRDLGSTVITFSASKDLSLPGLRAGLLVTKHAGVREEVRYDRLESTYQPSVVARSAVLVTVMAVAAAELHRQGSSVDDAATTVTELSRLRTAAVGLGAEWNRLAPTPTVLTGAVDHLAALSARCRANWEYLSTVFGADSFAHGGPVAGFSALLGLAPRWSAAGSSFAEWVNRVGREYDLKLNPSLLYGADVDTWRELYGSEAFLRLNLTDEPERLRRATVRLRAVLDSLDPG